MRKLTQSASVSMLITLLLVSVFHPNCYPQTGAPQRPGGWLEHWRASTISFGKMALDRNRPFFQVIGTGFIVAVDTHTGYIVTAKHVFDDPTSNWHPDRIRVRFAWQEHESVYANFGEDIKLKEASTALWKASEDGSDIAAIPLDPALAKTLPPGKNFEGIGLGEFGSEDWLFEGAPVIVLGYPGIVGSEYLARAVSRGGIVAWVNSERPTEGKFLVDANLYPGNSGGPVIAVPTAFVNPGQIRTAGGGALLGIVSQGPVQDLVITAGGQPVRFTNPNLPEPVQLQTQIKGVGSFGVIEPVRKLEKLLKAFQEKPR
jgi:Trypsin-like peptidase domain